MIDYTIKQKIIAEFSEFIETLPENSEFEIDPIDTVDLFTLYREFSVLKSEIKQESRQFKTAIENFKDVFKTLEKSHETLSKELEERRQEQQNEILKEHEKILKPVLSDLIEIRDKLEASTSFTKDYKSFSFMMRFFKKIKNFIEKINQGQLMTLRYMDYILSIHDVKRIDVLGKPFNPKLMKVISIESKKETPNGEVIEEIRKGFLWKESILRVADVKVNKLEEENLYEI